jgi:hypothetical protein
MMNVQRPTGPSDASSSSARARVAGDDHHAHAEQRRHRVADEEVDAARGERLGAGASFLADPVSIADDGERSAHAAHEGDRPRQAARVGLRDARHEQPLRDADEVRPDEHDGDHDAHEHDADADHHDALEEAEAPDPHERDRDRALSGAEDELRAGGVVEETEGLGEGVAGHPGAADERGAREIRPRQEIRGEEHPHRPAEAGHRALEDGLPRGKLPAGEPLGEHELQERAEGDRPQDRGAEPHAREARGGEIARPHAGRGHEHARHDDRDHPEPAPTCLRPRPCHGRPL